MQEVRTRVVYWCDDAPCAEFRSVYGEFFQVGAEARLADTDARHDLRDAHGFDLARDGWTPRALRTLFKRQRVQGADGRPWRARGTLRMTCEKRFVLAEGAVEDVAPCKRRGPDAQFGFVREGPRESARASLVLRGGLGGAEVELTPATPFPFESPGQGSARWMGEAGYAVVERFAYHYATDSLSFDDADGYVQIALADADVWTDS